MEDVTANDRTYPAPRSCAIAICLDGCEPEYLDVAIAEDIAVLEQQQQGLASPFARPGRFSHLEPNVARFERWLAERCLAE